jgi:integrase
MNEPGSNGNQRADKSLAVRSAKLVTVQDLLSAIPKSGLLSSMYTAAGHVSNFLNIPLEQLPIEALTELSPAAFKLHLRQRKYKPHSIRSYRGFIRILVNKAKDLGWGPGRLEIPDCWKPILSAVKADGGTKIVRYAIRLGISPSKFSDDDLAVWAETLLAEGRSYLYVHNLKSRFRRIVTSRYAKQFPQLSKPSSAFQQYGVPLRDFPSALRADVMSLLKWKQADFAPGRPRKCHHRAVTAIRLKDTIVRLYGFVTTVNHGNGHGRYHVGESRITSLPALVTRESVTAWVDWCINERKNKGSHVTGDLALIYAAMRYYPLYKDYDFAWLGKLILEIPEDPESGITESKARKYVPYALLSDIPRMLHEKRKEIGARGERQLAWLVHDELLMRWLTTLVWRQRNIRESRIGSNAELVNLFKGTIPPFVTMAKPKWVEEKLAVGPQERFWQFYFREDETKNGHEVRAFLPRQLVGPLEEYLELYRPSLLQGREPGTLFVNRTGEPLSGSSIRDLVANITLRYVHRRVTPHVYRDIFAYKWLDDHPEDYLTLSKILWHRNINTTLQKYGRRFDESSGIRKLEEWLV